MAASLRSTLTEGVLCLQEAGACECREGFTGFHCDRCAPGHRNFPTCEPCPCDPRGSEHAADCNGECFCKVGWAAIGVVVCRLD